MSRYLFDPTPVPAVPVRGIAQLYPIRRIFCVGRNYEAHAREMGVIADREAPFYFTKTPLDYVPTGATLSYPPGTSNYHYEMELVVAIGAPAFRVSAADAPASIYGYACGLDMTRRDLQLSERAKQRPWTLGKDVEASAPTSSIAPVARIGHPGDAALRLKQNGVVKQDSNISQLVWSVSELIAHLSGFYHLAPGDLIFTGTPAGVGPVAPGDLLEVEISGIANLTTRIGPAE